MVEDSTFGTALMLTWVVLVAPFVLDWALLSLDSILHDPGFNPKEMKSGPFKNSGLSEWFTVTDTRENQASGQRRV